MNNSQFSFLIKIRWIEINKTKGVGEKPKNSYLGKLEEGGTGIEQAIDAFSRKQLIPAPISSHGFRATSGENLKDRAELRDLEYEEFGDFEGFII